MNSAPKIYPMEANASDLINEIDALNNKDASNNFRKDDHNNNKNLPTSNQLKASRMIFKEDGHKASVCALCHLNINEEYIQDTFIFSGGDDKTIMIWSLKLGIKVGELVGHTAKVTGLVCYDEKDLNSTKKQFIQTPILISCSWDETVRIWNIYQYILNNYPNNNSNQTIKKIEQIEDSKVKEKILRGHKNVCFNNHKLSLYICYKYI